MIAVLVLERLEETWLSTIEEGGGGIEVELSLVHLGLKICKEIVIERQLGIF